MLLTCSRAKDVDRADKCLDYTRGELGLETAASHWDVLIGTYAEAGLFDRARSLLRKMDIVYKFKLSTSNYNKVLKAVILRFFANDYRVIL